MEQAQGRISRITQHIVPEETAGKLSSRRLHWI